MKTNPAINCCQKGLLVAEARPAKDLGKNKILNQDLFAFCYFFIKKAEIRIVSQFPQFSARSQWCEYE